MFRGPLAHGEFVELVYAPYIAGQFAQGGAVEAVHADIRNKTYLLLPQATGTRRNHERRMQRAAIQTEWGGSEDERVDQVLRALGDPGAKELILAYEADRQDITALQTV